jgi:hypothetical protein
MEDPGGTMKRHPLSNVMTGTARPHEGRPLLDPDEEIFDQGLVFDLDTPLDRRRMLKLLGVTSVGAGLLLVHELGTVTGNVNDGFVVELTVPVSAS